MPAYLTSVLKEFRYYKKLGERALIQVSEDDLFRFNSREENTIGVIVQHLSGNMKSRWTNIWEEDGEKEWRNRDREFKRLLDNREELLKAWDEGWQVLFNTLDSCSEKDLERLVYIRNQGHTLIEAINRQLAHYAYHIGQIVLLSKSYAKDDWKSLTIPLGESSEYNEKKFSEEKKRGHFTDDLM